MRDGGRCGAGKVDGGEDVGLVERIESMGGGSLDGRIL